MKLFDGSPSEEAGTPSQDPPIYSRTLRFCSTHHTDRLNIFGNKEMILKASHYTLCAPRFLEFYGMFLRAFLCK